MPDEVGDFPLPAVQISLFLEEQDTHTLSSLKLQGALVPHRLHNLRNSSHGGKCHEQ